MVPGGVKQAFSRITPSHASGSSSLQKRARWASRNGGQRERGNCFIQVEARSRRPSSTASGSCAGPAKVTAKSSCGSSSWSRKATPKPLAAEIQLKVARQTHSSTVCVRNADDRPNRIARCAGVRRLAAAMEMLRCAEAVKMALPCTLSPMGHSSCRRQVGRRPPPRSRRREFVDFRSKL
jgi:hypothetical protein